MLQVTQSNIIHMDLIDHAFAPRIYGTFRKYHTHGVNNIHTHTTCYCPVKDKIH
jgi:hypothetical protein